MIETTHAVGTCQAVRELQARLDSGNARRWTEGPFRHWPWCDPKEHAAWARETGWDDLCAGRKMAEAYEGEWYSSDGRPVEIRGQWRAFILPALPGHPRFDVDPIGELRWYGVRTLRDHLTGVEAPRAVALRKLLGRAIAEQESGT